MVRATVVMAGAIAEAKYLGDRNVSKYVAGKDLADLRQLAESAGCTTPEARKQFAREARRQAEAILRQPAAKKAVEALARQLFESGGRLLYETAPELPKPPKEIEAFQQQRRSWIERMSSEIWGKNYQ
jgi:hypothetical protein